jgi:hypothetical protein
VIDLAREALIGPTKANDRTARKQKSVRFPDGDREFPAIDDQLETCELQRS